MSISLFVDERNQAFVVFGKKENSFECNSKNLDVQILFLMSILQKYKKIVILKYLKKNLILPGLSKHYLKTDEFIMIQKSYSKFFKKKLSEEVLLSLTFKSIYELLN